ncbi:MAG TPA: hypothetical protein VNI02_06335 [Blastocatellia bacterium]|jgi:hypothetical protein|nr:hypothetical protein [Blastocatellia bacterium]
MTTLRAGLIVAAFAAILSVTSFGYFFSHDMTNLYGDGVAHVNIARKVVDSPDDSLWQRYIQIGSPWLPVQTVLMLPLVVNDWMWRTGMAGSVVSMISYVVAALSLYLLARNFYRREDGRHRELLAATTAAIFLLNPGAVYMQATPMTEAVFMATLALAICLLQRWVAEQTKGRLAAAAFAMTTATLTRYEAWPVAALSVVIVILVARGDARAKAASGATFAAIVAAGPAYWLWHNWAIYGNALEFLTGPHSARGLYLQNQANLGWAKIFVGHLFIDVLMILITAAVCAGPFVLALGAVGFITFMAARRKTLLEDAPVLLLTVPFFFHVFSLYRGEIQIFPLSAFGLHNVRYGLPHLLAIALFAPASVLLLKRESRRRAGVAVCLIVAAQYFYLISDGPGQLAVYQEGYRNGVNARPARERREFSSLIKANPPEPTVLMNTGELGPIVSQGGLRYSDIIHEGTLRWHQINDSIPADVSTVIVKEDDPLDKRLRGNPSLARDVAEHFQERLSVGRIKLFRRK